MKVTSIKNLDYTNADWVCYYDTSQGLCDVRAFPADYSSYDFIYDEQNLLIKHDWQKIESLVILSKLQKEK